MASKSSTISGKYHTPFCGGNCELSHHDLVSALFTDGRFAISRIGTGDLPTALKQAIDSAMSAGWDPNCFVPDPSRQLRCPLLFLACAFGKFAIVKGLLRNNFSPSVLNQHGETALHFAARHFHLNKATANFDRKGAFKKIVHVLTEHDPKTLAAKDRNGCTALHISASSILLPHRKGRHKKAKFYQFCLKTMMERLVELKEASVFTKHEVTEIMKSRENNGGSSVLHILAQSSTYFEVLKFARDLLFDGKLPEDKNGQGKTILSIAWDTDPRGAVKFFSLSPSSGQQEQGDSTQSEANLSCSVSGDMSASVDDTPVESMSDHCYEPELPASELDLKDEEELYFESDTEENVPCVDKVFSLSVGECAAHGEECGCCKSSEDAITSLKKHEFFSLSRDIECLVGGRRSDAIKKPDSDTAPTSQSNLQMGQVCQVNGKKSYCKDKLEDSFSLTKVESGEVCVEMNQSNSDNHPAKLSYADNTFMEFVVTEGLGLEPEAKKNIVGVVMAQYSKKLSQIEGRIPKLEKVMKEEEMALHEKKEKLNDLEEKVAFLKKDVLAKEKCLAELREQNEVLCKEENMLKRKVSHCQELQNQLENGVDVKKVRSE